MPTWTKKFNFRATDVYVADGLNQTYVLALDTYPVTRNGVTFGWDFAVQGANRSTTVDVRLAGVNFQVGNSVFRVDLPAAGAYITHLAVGDINGGGTGTQTVTVRDNGTDLFSLAARTYSTANQFYDAMDTALTDVTWPAGEQGRGATFASAIHQTALLDSAFWVLAHLSISDMDVTVGRFTRPFPFKPGSVAVRGL